MPRFNEDTWQALCEVAVGVLLMVALILSVILLNGCITIKGDLVLIKGGPQQSSVSSRKPDGQVRPVTSRPANPISDLLFGGDQ